MTVTERAAPMGVPFRALGRVPLFLTGTGALVLCAALSLALGARSLPLPTVAGALSGRTLDVLWPVLPTLVLGLIVALAVAPALNALALGDDSAQTLGVPVVRPHPRSPTR